MTTGTAGRISQFPAECGQAVLYLAAGQGFQLAGGAALLAQYLSAAPIPDSG
jgi:hypothetical protein